MRYLYDRLQAIRKSAERFCTVCTRLVLFTHFPHTDNENRVQNRFALFALNGRNTNNRVVQRDFALFALPLYFPHTDNENRVQRDFALFALAPLNLCAKNPPLRGVFQNRVHNPLLMTHLDVHTTGVR